MLVTSSPIMPPRISGFDRQSPLRARGTMMTGTALSSMVPESSRAVESSTTSRTIAGLMSFGEAGIEPRTVQRLLVNFS